MSTVTIARSVPVPPNGAWEAWTDAGQLARWWWPQLPDTTYDWAPAVGATYSIDSPTAGFGVRGVFTEVDPPRRLACTWFWIGESADPPEDLVEVTFEPEGTGTLVTVRHTSTEHIEGGGVEQGWNDVMDRLARIDQLV